MNYYTKIVPAELVERLYKAGCPNIGRYERDGKELYQETTYADVFDGLIEKDISIKIEPEQLLGGWLVTIERISKIKVYTGDDPFSTWHEAANAAIEGAIEILKESEKCNHQ